MVPQFENDEAFTDECIDHLKLHYSIDVFVFLKMNHYDQLYKGKQNADREFNSLVRRVRQRILKKHQYEEDTEMGNNFYRIRFIKNKSWKERFWLPIAFTTLAIGWFADIGKEAFLRKQKQESPISKPVSPILSDTTRSHNAAN